MLGEGFQGIACSDRWWAYNYLDPARRQVCWSHIVRDFTAQSEGLEPEKSFGQAGLAIAGRLFSAWDDFHRDGDRAQLIERVAPLRRELKPLLERYESKSPKYKARAGLPATCSRCGLRFGPSPRSTASSRPTTAPSAASGARSSTGNCRSGASPTRASARSSVCSRPPRPVASSGARSSPTWPASSAPRRAATPFPRHREAELDGTRALRGARRSVRLGRGVASRMHDGRDPNARAGSTTSALRGGETGMSGSGLSQALKNIAKAFKNVFRIGKR